MARERSNLDEAIQELRDAKASISVMAICMSQIVFQPRLRRLLMSLKDDVKAALDRAMTAARKEKDVEAGLRSTVTALQEQTTALTDRITQMENTPGPWTDGDMSEIKQGIEAITAALDPEAVTAAVMAGTGEAAGSSGAGTGGGNSG